jgi:hypothetical protein
MLLEVVDPAFLSNGHSAAWDAALELMVDAAKRARGLKSVHGNDAAVEAARFFATDMQTQPGTVVRPKVCPSCAATTGGFRNLGMREDALRTWQCKACKHYFKAAD